MRSRSVARVGGRPGTVAFHPDHLARGDKYIGITYDSLDETTISKDASTPPLVSEHRNQNAFRSFPATQGADANKPQFIAGEGIRYRTIGGVRRWLDTPNVEVTMDIHSVAVLFKVDPALCASEVNGFTLNGTSTSAGLRWPFFHIKSDGTTVTVLAGWWENNAPAEGGYTGHTFTGTGWHSFVSTVRNGVVYSSLDGGPIQSHSTNIRPSRNTSGALGIKGSFHSTRDLEYTENYLRIGSTELSDVEIHKMHGFLAWSRLKSSAHLVSDAVYKRRPPTSALTPVRADRTRRSKLISIPTQITPITPDESYSYQQTLAWTSDVPTGFTQTFESQFTAGVSDITHEATGAGPWWAPAVPPVPQNGANYGSGNNMIWAAHNDSTAIVADATGVKLGFYRVTSGAAPCRPVSISSMNHEGSVGFAQKHGYFAARVRLDTIARTSGYPDMWSTPGPWLYSVERLFDRSSVYGELDYPEVYSKDPLGFHGTIHEHDPAWDGQPGNHYNSDIMKSNYIGSDFSDVAKWNLGSNGFYDGNFHEYGVLLDPERELIICYVDRREVERRPYPKGMQNMRWYMLFWNLAYKINVTDNDPSMTWMGPHYLTIDWVRAFQKPAWVNL